MNQNDPLNFINKLLHLKMRPSLEDYVKGRRTTGPVVVEFDPTTNCNFECPECISLGLLNKGQISPSRATELLNEFHSAGVKGIIFIGGGEPLAHTNIAGLITHAHTLGLSVGITTNGILINRHISIIAEYVNWIRVSVDAGRKATFEQFRPSRIPSSFEKVIKNIEELSKIKKGVLGYSFLVMSRTQQDGSILTNCNEILEAATLAKEIGCDYFEFKPMVDSNHHLVPFSPEVHRAIEEQLPSLHNLEDETYRVIYPNSIPHLLNQTSSDQPKTYTKCATTELRTVVTPKGIYPCPYKRGNEEDRLGDINVNFDIFWNSAERHQNSDRINPSKDCPFYCIRHQTNIIANFLSDAHSEGIDLLPYMIQLDTENDVFI